VEHICVCKSRYTKNKCKSSHVIHKQFLEKTEVHEFKNNYCSGNLPCPLGANTYYQHHYGLEEHPYYENMCIYFSQSEMRLHTRTNYWLTRYSIRAVDKLLDNELYEHFK